MSNLSELLPSGGGQNVGSFAASGTITNGQLVGLRSDGKVEAISSITQSITAGQVIETDAISVCAGVWDESNQRAVFMYRRPNNGGVGSARIATLTGTTFGNISSAVTIISSGSTIITDIAACYDPNNNKVICAYANSGVGYASVGTVDVANNTITWGSKVQWASSIEELDVCYDPDAQRIICFGETTTNGKVYSNVGTVSGTSITFGTQAEVESSGTFYNPKLAYSTGDNKVCCFYSGGSSSYTGYVRVGTVNSANNSISWSNAASTVNNVKEDYGSAAFAYHAKSDKFFLGYTERQQSDYAYYMTGNIVSGVFNALTAQTTESNASTYHNTSPCLEINQIAYNYTTGSTTKFKNVTDISSSGIVTFGTVQGNQQGQSRINTINFWMKTPVKITQFASNANLGDDGEAVVFTPASDNISSFIGLAGQAISDTATGNVDMLGGINSQQTSLTIAGKYYIQSNGTLGTTSTSTFVGQAVSATTLNIRDLT